VPAGHRILEGTHLEIAYNISGNKPDPTGGSQISSIMWPTVAKSIHLLQSKPRKDAYGDLSFDAAIDSATRVCVPKCEVQGIGWRLRTHPDGVPSMSYAEARNGGD